MGGDRQRYLRRTMAIWQKTSVLKRRAEWLSSQTFVVLSIQVPKDNEKSPQSAEQFFASLHGIYRNDPIIQEHVSFEIVAKKDAIGFYIFTPIHLRDFIEGQLYAQYPDLLITQVGDYTKGVELEGKHVAASKIQLTKEDVFPIKTYTGLEIDTLAGISAVLSGLEDKEQIWLQIVVRPVGDDWQNRGVKYVQDRRAGKKGSAMGSDVTAKLTRFAIRFGQEIMQPGTGGGEMGKPTEPPKLSAPEEAALKAIESKVTKLGFETIFRILVISPDVPSSRSRILSILAAYKQFNTTNLNGFTGGEVKIDDFSSWEQYISREFEAKGNILNIEELASVYHFPNQSVEASAISWAGSKKGEAPFNLPLKEQVDPKDLTVLGRTDFRNSSEEFGIRMDDRMRHVYVIGKSGTGKSTLLENMVIDDINEGRGVIVVDPHGELADKTLECIPESRIQDVVLFDPSDRDHPIAFNILDVTSDDQKPNVASGFVAGLKKIFGNSWGPRLEYILRNATLAVLDSEYPTMLGIPRMLTDPGFRNEVIPRIKDPVVKDFWKTEWAAKDQKQQVEEMGSILNKVGQFLSASLIRNIVGQPKSGFDIRQIMDEKKILIVNLSKGKIGEDNSALLGTMMITKVQLAAMSRADVPPSQRPACFLYVDEFQNFATDSFATILSEARKYSLGLTVAHQYIAQMSPEVKDAVFGNVGSIISFRVGSDDASSLKPEFAPIFDENDLVNLQRGHVYIKLLIDGLAVPAFSAQTFPPKPVVESFKDRVVAHSRETYALTRFEAEDLIDETAGYKKRREAEEASKAAQDMLASGASLAIHPPRQSAPAPMQPIPKPVQQVRIEEPIAVPQQIVVAEELPVPAVIQPQVTQPEVIEQTPTFNLPTLAPQQAEEETERVIKEKPLKILDEYVYKEVSQRGGLRWYLGEQEDVVKKRMEEKRLLKEQQKLEEAESPMAFSPTEQNTNVPVL